MAILRNIHDRIHLKAESADLSAFLTAATKSGIEICDFRIVEGICATFSVRRRDYPLLDALAQRKGVRIQILARSGIYWHLLGLFHRPVLIFGISLILFLAFWLPGKILFVQVAGNGQIPASKILEAAQQCGLYFGADRAKLRSEKVKNNLLEQIPQLQWVGVNSAGCVATIHVRERTPETQTPSSGGISSIVADRDGVILSCTGAKGNLLCKPGQAVKAGDVLISGYTDCGLSIRAEEAQGEVYAQTSRTVQAVMPASSQQKGQCLGAKKKYGILIGKKRINFYKDCGILPAGCDKIYKQYYVVLPGGFQLPVAFVEETWYTYDSAVISVSEDSVKESLELFSKTYLASQMVGGQVLQSDVSFDVQDDLWILRGEYVCAEIIGLVRREEIIKANGENY